MFPRVLIVFFVTIQSVLAELPRRWKATPSREARQTPTVPPEGEAPLPLAARKEFPTHTHTRARLSSRPSIAHFY
jgi:hypothetical protein